MVLRGERVQLRPLADNDVETVLAILREPEVARWWGEYDAAGVREEMLDECETFAIELGDELIGIVMLYEEEEQYRHASLDITLATAHHNRGLGREALRLVIDHLVNDRGHDRFTIDPDVINERAIRSYAAVGFKPVGVMRRYHRHPTGVRDGLLMDLLADERL
jgi:aminoglycoside 6'-N-acetyltransferase